MSSRRANPSAQAAADPSTKSVPNRRAIDATSFAAGSESGAPQGQRILRSSPNLLRNLRGRGAGSRGPGRGPGLGLRMPPRNPNRRQGAQGQQGGNRQRRGKRQDMQDDAENPYAHLSPQEKQALLQKFEDERPKPVPYVPRGYDIDGALTDTWPALPIGKDGLLASVRAQFSKMGARYANAWDAPSDLAKRLIAGKPVLFRSTEEKEKVVDVAKELLRREAAAQEIATGEKQEPQSIDFASLDTETRQEVFNRLVRGGYGDSMPDISKDAPAMVGSVAKNLQNNSSYQQSEMQTFINLLKDKLPKKAAAGKR